MSLFLKKDYLISQFDTFGQVFANNAEELAFVMKSLAEENRLKTKSVVVSFELGGYSIKLSQ